MTQGCVSLASHALHREEGSGHTVTIELLPRNEIMKHSGKIIICWHLLNKLWHNCYSMTMDAIYEQHESDWSYQSFCRGDNSMLAAWPDPSSLQRVWLARLRVWACVRRLTISLLKPLQVSVVDLGIGDGMFTCRHVGASSIFSAANHRDLPRSTKLMSLSLFKQQFLGAGYL